MINATGCAVTLYTQRNCAESPRVRAWLNREGVPFTERNVSNDAAAVAELAATGIFATPLTTVCGQPVVGFRPAEIAKTIEQCEVRRSHKRALTT